MWHHCQTPVPLADIPVHALDCPHCVWQMMWFTLDQELFLFFFCWQRFSLFWLKNHNPEILRFRFYMFEILCVSIHEDTSWLWTWWCVQSGQRSAIALLPSQKNWRKLLLWWTFNDGPLFVPTSLWTARSTKRLLNLDWTLQFAFNQLHLFYLPNFEGDYLPMKMLRYDNKLL